MLTLQPLAFKQIISLEPKPKYLPTLSKNLNPIQDRSIKGGTTGREMERTTVKNT